MRYNGVKEGLNEMRNDCIYFCPIRVRYGEVDMQGVVYNCNYAVYTDVAFEEFWRSRGYTYKSLANEYASEICHRKATFEYLSSGFDDDVLEIGVRVIRVGTNSFTLGYEIYRQGEDDLLVAAEIVYAGYDKEKRCSRPITDIMRGILKEA